MWAYFAVGFPSVQRLSLKVYYVCLNLVKGFFHMKASRWPLHLRRREKC